MTGCLSVLLYFFNLIIFFFSSFSPPLNLHLLCHAGYWTRAMCMAGKCSTSGLHFQFLVLWNSISLDSQAGHELELPPSSVLSLTKCLGHRCVLSHLVVSGSPLWGLKTPGCTSNKWHVVRLNLPLAYKMNTFLDILKWFCFEWTGIAQG